MSERPESPGNRIIWIVLVLLLALVEPGQRYALPGTDWHGVGTRGGGHGTARVPLLIALLQVQLLRATHEDAKHFAAAALPRLGEAPERAIVLG